MRLIDADKLIDNLIHFAPEHYTSLINMLIEKQPQVDAVPVIRCKNCMHKPKPTEDYNPSERDSGFEIEFPDYMCPMQCEDAYYSRIPKDDWFCGNAERRQDG